MYSEIQQLKCEGLNKSQIARKLGLNLNYSRKSPRTLQCQ